MNILNTYYSNIIKYNLITKFDYKKIDNVPEITKIILNFNCKNFELKHLATSLLALQLITKKKGTLTTAKKPNIILKIKKGNPVGCKINLKKMYMYNFLFIFITKIVPRFKNVMKKKIKKINVVTYTITNTLTFKKLEKNYLIFNSLKSVNINIVTTAKTKQELFFIFKLLKIKHIEL